MLVLRIPAVLVIVILGVNFNIVESQEVPILEPTTLVVYILVSIEAVASLDTHKLIEVILQLDQMGALLGESSGNL